MNGDDPEETMPFTHRPYGREPKDEPFASPSGPAEDPPTPSWETYEQPVQPAYPPAPYGQAPYGQAPYGQSPYGVAMAPHPQANTAMVLGIVGLVGTFVCVLPVVLGPFAWATGAKVRREIDAEPQRWGGRGEGTAGFVLGIITTILLVLFVLFIVLGVGLAISVGT